MLVCQTRRGKVAFGSALKKLHVQCRSDDLLVVSEAGLRDQLCTKSGGVEEGSLPWSEDIKLSGLWFDESP